MQPPAPASMSGPGGAGQEHPSWAQHRAPQKYPGGSWKGGALCSPHCPWGGTGAPEMGCRPPSRREGVGVLAPRPMPSMPAHPCSHTYTPTHSPARAHTPEHTCVYIPMHAHAHCRGQQTSPGAFPAPFTTSLFSPSPNPGVWGLQPELPRAQLTEEVLSRAWRAGLVL